MGFRKCKFRKHSREDPSDTSTISDPDNASGQDVIEENSFSSKENANEHSQQLRRLKKKDPAFYQFLQEHDKELLEFNDDADITGIPLANEEAERPENISDKVQKLPAKVITTTMVASWCESIGKNGSVSAVRSLLCAFRTACHCGDDGFDMKFSVMSSSVFNRIMIFVLKEMDTVLRNLLGFAHAGGKKEDIINLMSTKRWQKYGKLMISYLANSLHILNQMTDIQMISFTLRRLKFSVVFLAASQSLLRKYIKVALHFWGSGGGALPVVSFLFLRDICLQLGLDSLETCLKGIYRTYILHCQSVTAKGQQHIQFLRNCVTELYGLDFQSSYQHAFIFIRQLAMILREVLNAKTKESYRRVCERKYLSCLDLWTLIICCYSSNADFRRLAYPLTQVIMGVARLVPTAKHFPVRVRCSRMLNQIAASTNTFIPVSGLLLDALEMKELIRPSTGGVGKAIDFHLTTKVNKAMTKTRGFQEACMLSFVEELAEHLALWSYSVAFFELSFLPLVRLRSYCKATKVDKLRKEIKELICKIEESMEFTNSKRLNIKLSPNDPSAVGFLEVEKMSKASPLSHYVESLHLRAKHRRKSMESSRVIVGEAGCILSEIPEIIDEQENQELKEETAVLHSTWLPGTKPGKKKQAGKCRPETTEDEDIVEDLILSSDEDKTCQPSSLDVNKVSDTFARTKRKRKHPKKLGQYSRKLAKF